MTLDEPESNNFRMLTPLEERKGLTLVVGLPIICGMRRLRNFQPDRCYHLISRIAQRTFFITDEERMRFVDRLWRVAAFSGGRDHRLLHHEQDFHVLACFPVAPEFDDAELFVRIRKLHSGERLSKILKEWETSAKCSDQRCMDDFRRRFKKRSGRVSIW